MIYEVVRYNEIPIRYNVLIKIKLKFTLEQATKAQRGSRGIALLCL